MWPIATILDSTGLSFCLCQITHPDSIHKLSPAFILETFPFLLNLLWQIRKATKFCLTPFIAEIHSSHICHVYHHPIYSFLTQNIKVSCKIYLWGSPMFLVSASVCLQLLSVFCLIPLENRVELHNSCFSWQFLQAIVSGLIHTILDDCDTTLKGWKSGKRRNNDITGNEENEEFQSSTQHGVSKEMWLVAVGRLAFWAHLCHQQARDIGHIRDSAFSFMEWRVWTRGSSSRCLPA